ncbi:aminoglycoside N(3)-acetyltransferase [Streptomyces hyaluromycini]|uniref:aminoglycoside N(3)-acetyltransferase n=1 Tax=Streptomyces hyaluromycini TaxID=1377993 RepID=UPI000B5C9E3A|nr:AAC(3) family N-acetyltransferase [Streptomyces hyaluromycini]
MSAGDGHRALARGLAELGLRPGATVLAHASLQCVGAGPDTVLAALLDTLGPHGTVVVPTFTAGNSDTSPSYRNRTRDMTEHQLDLHHTQMPAFEWDRTPSEGMGRLAEAVRCSAGAVRSAHPQTSFAALGMRARQLTSGHDEECHLGEHSPLARLERAGAQVLLLGVGYDVCSAFHLAEYRVAEPPLREYRCVVLRDGGRTWTSYKDVDLDDSDFAALGADFEEQVPVVRRGAVGAGEARLFPLAEAVRFAAHWLSGNRPHGVSHEPSQNAAGFLH